MAACFRAHVDPWNEYPLFGLTQQLDIINFHLIADEDENREKEKQR